MILHIIEKDWDALSLQLLIVLIYWVVVIIAAGIDLYYGIQVSKQKGGYIRSKGLQASTQKLVRYLSLMTLMLLGDVINPLFIFWELQQIPVFSFLGAFVLVYTEYKSIKEKFDPDFQKELDDNVIELLRFVKDNKELLAKVKSKNKENA